MDLNRKYFEHQIALMLASSARSDLSRARHHADADSIGRGIGSFQKTIGAAAGETWDSLGHIAMPRVACS